MKYSTMQKSTVWQQLLLDASMPNAVYIFISPDSALNKLICKEFASALVCQEHSYCGKCDDCVRVELGKHPDIIEYDKKALAVADANEIVDKTMSTPIFARYKIFIIHNADVMNEQAQNKLLKTLEEPNDSSIFILSTTREFKLLPTILSRGRKVYLSLKDCLDTVAQFGRAIDSLTDYELSEQTSLLRQQAQHLFDGFNNKQDIATLVGEINISPADRLTFLQFLYSIYLRHFSQNAELVAIFDLAISRLNSNVNFNYVLDNLLLALKEKIL